MAEFLSDPSVLTKDKLKSALVANNVTLPNGEQRKGVYVELYLKNLTSQNKKSGGSVEVFSSDDEPAAPEASITARSGRKATRKTDRVRPEEIDVSELTDEDLKDQLLKYGVNAGPIVASTRKVYEKKLQKLLDQGPPQTTIIAASEPVLTHNSNRNGSTDSDQFSDKEEATVPELEPEQEHEPEPVPVVERPLRSRGKTPVTTRTRSSQQKEEDVESEEEDFQVVNVVRKSRSSYHRLDHVFPDPVSGSEMLPVPRERRRFSALPIEPMPLLADELATFRSVSMESPDHHKASVHAAVGDYSEAILTDKFYKRARLPEKTMEVEPLRTPSPSCQRERKYSQFSKHTAALAKVRSDEVQRSILNTALLEQVDPHEDLKSRPGHVELRSASSFKRTKQPDSPQLSRDLIHAACCLSPSQATRGKDVPCSLTGTDSSHNPPCGPRVTKSSSGVKERSGASAEIQSRIDGFFSPVTPVHGQDNSIRDQTPEALIEKLSAVEQTPKTTERNVLKDLFPNEVLNTPTGISATCRRPIKGAAGRPFSDTWQDSLRPRLTEHRYTTSSYTETRSVPHASVIPRLSAVPLSIPKPTATLGVQAKARRRVPVWVQLLLLAAVAGFLLFVYQTMESNQINPFGHLSSSNQLETSGK